MDWVSKRPLLLAVSALAFFMPTSAQMISDGDILDSLFASCGGEGWIDNASWMNLNISVCDRRGISCNDSGSVERVQLTASNLVCALPSETFYLPELKVLDLSGNSKLSVDFSQLEIERVASLRHLFLSDCEITSLRGLGASFANSLLALSLAGGSITGRFPSDEIFGLPLLEHLDLSFNFFSGTIPVEIGGLQNLKILSLDHNLFDGKVPSEIGQPSHLNGLSLQFNQLEGALPTELLQLHSLATFSANDQKQGEGDEQLGGLIGPILDFADMPFLFFLNLSNNLHSGSIPATILSSVDDFYSPVMMVDLSGNQLTGEVPSALTRYRSIRIFLVKNRIQSVPEVLCDKSEWFFGEVGQFGCNAILCPPGTFGFFGRQISERYPCQPCPATGQEFFGGTSCEQSFRGPFDASDSPFKATSASDGVSFNLTIGTEANSELQSDQFPSRSKVIYFEETETEPSVADASLSALEDAHEDVRGRPSLAWGASSLHVSEHNQYYSLATSGQSHNFRSAFLVASAVWLASVVW